MSERLSLDSFWHSAPGAGTVFNAAVIANLPDIAKRYFTHTIAPGTPLARAVRLRMHGEIKLKDWGPFSAEEVIRSDRGLIWQAAVRMKGLPVRAMIVSSTVPARCVGSCLDSFPSLELPALT